MTQSIESRRILQLKIYLWTWEFCPPSHGKVEDLLAKGQIFKASIKHFHNPWRYTLCWPPLLFLPLLDLSAIVADFNSEAPPPTPNLYSPKLIRKRISVTGNIFLLIIIILGKKLNKGVWFPLLPDCRFKLRLLSFDYSCRSL